MTAPTIYAAGCDNTPKIEAAQRVGYQNLLVSYAYLRTRPDQIREWKGIYPEARFFIDSGAFSFFQESAAGKVYNYEEYLEEYVGWLKDNKGLYVAAAELDIESITDVGWPKVREWEQKYFEPLEDDEIDIVYIWHRPRGYAEWQRMIRRHSYVAFSGKDPDTESVVQSFAAAAKSNLTRCHGLAIVEAKNLPQYPFYSVDAITWLTGAAYGKTIVFDGTRLMTISDKSRRPSFRAQWEREGLDYGLIDADDPYEIYAVNLLGFRKLNEHWRKFEKTKSIDLRPPRVAVGLRRPQEEIDAWVGKVFNDAPTNAKEVFLGACAMINEQAGPVDTLRKYQVTSRLDLISRIVEGARKP